MAGVQEGVGILGVAEAPGRRCLDDMEVVPLFRDGAGVHFSRSGFSGTSGYDVATMDFNSDRL